MIPDEIANLLARSVKSVWALELLLFLRQRADESWTIDKLSAELRSSAAVVNGVLPILVRDNLAEESARNRYRYAATRDLDRLVGELEAIYRERPVAVVRAITLASDDRLQKLADAFKFKKD